MEPDVEAVPAHSIGDPDNAHARLSTFYWPNAPLARPFLISERPTRGHARTKQGRRKEESTWNSCHFPSWSTSRLSRGCSASASGTYEGWSPSDGCLPSRSVTTSDSIWRTYASGSKSSDGRTPRRRKPLAVEKYRPSTLVLVTISVRLPDDVARRVEAVAVERGASVESTAVELLTTALDEAAHLTTPPRTPRHLAFAGIGASDGTVPAARADELLADGFGRD